MVGRELHTLRHYMEDHPGLSGMAGYGGGLIRRIGSPDIRSATMSAFMSLNRMKTMGKELCWIRLRMAIRGTDGVLRATSCILLVTIWVLLEMDGVQDVGHMRTYKITHTRMRKSRTRTGIIEGQCTRQP